MEWNIIKVQLKTLKNSHKPPIQLISIHQNIKYQEFYQLLSQFTLKYQIENFRFILTARDNLQLTQQKFQNYLKQLPQDPFCRYLTIQQYDQLEDTVWAYRESEKAQGSDSDQGAELIQDQESENSQGGRQIKSSEELQLNLRKLDVLLGKIPKSQPVFNSQEDIYFKNNSKPFFSSEESEKEVDLLSVLGLVQKNDLLDTMEQTQFASLLAKGLKTYYCEK